jgi:pyruvate/2-oxoglutarate dehydrogenase complex dihydrolipoamide acyltransferase (E2) component
VGSISERLALIGGGLVVREFLHLTLTFDHDIVDGGPAARFTERLAQLLETGYGLEDAQPVSAALS